ncbi:MAG: monooxygenase, partial [Gammaproteobacteria bacterium]
MHNIGIVGAGVAGLHLALYLQQRDVDATIITDRRPEEYRDLPLLNTVAHHSSTLERETALGVNHWTDPSDHYFYHDHWFNFPEPLHFPGHFARPSRAVDYRVYLPRLMEDFAARGGAIEFARIEQDDIEPLMKR